MIQKGDSVLINMQFSGVEDPGEDWVVCAWVAMLKACLTAYGREFVFGALVLHHSACQEYPFKLAQFGLSLCILILHDPLWVI